MTCVTETKVRLERTYLVFAPVLPLFAYKWEPRVVARRVPRHFAAANWERLRDSATVFHLTLPAVSPASATFNRRENNLAVTLDREVYSRYAISVKTYIIKNMKSMKF